jgi:hypothetical protein
MGLNTSKRKFLTNDEIDKQNYFNKTLERLFYRSRDYDGYLKHRDLDILLQRRVSFKIIKRLYKIFASGKEKFSYEDLRHFYALFRTNNTEAKVNFIAALIFPCKETKPQCDYLYSSELVFKDSPEMLSYLLASHFLKKITDKNNKVTRENFMKNFIVVYRKELEAFNFLKLYSYTNTKNSKDKFEEDLNALVCGCFLLDNKNGQNENNSIYDKMEYEFHRMEKVNGGVFTIQILEKMLVEIDISQPLINYLISYLKRKTEKVKLTFN